MPHTRVERLWGNAEMRRRAAAVIRLARQRSRVRMQAGEHLLDPNRVHYRAMIETALAIAGRRAVVPSWLYRS